MAHWRQPKGCLTFFIAGNFICATAFESWFIFTLAGATTCMAHCRTSKDVLAFIIAGTFFGATT
jgi:hypothetical protein